ncbi:putative L,D-transpeptidase [Clostridium neonatale]|nr:putative L,D-transpeptidase [Clostridium neonatale]
MTYESFKSSKIFKSLMIFSCTLFIVCFALTSKGTIALAKTLDSTNFEDYTLTLEERGDYKEKLVGSDFNLKFDEENKVAYFNENLLKECVNNLNCVNQKVLIKAQNARFEYENNKYVIVKEVQGNEVVKDYLYEKIVNAIKNGDKTLNLEEEGCYILPTLTSDSESMKSTLALLNKYASTKITYNFAGKTKYVDGSVIKDWISVDGNNNVTINESRVKGFVDYMAYIYSTELGKTIVVSGGSNGNNNSWSIDSAAETKALINHIKYGQVLSKHPTYKQNASGSYFSNVGNTFVEVDITKQHIWYYKNGYLVTQGDIVTGNLSVSGCATPTGVYSLNFKQRDTKLIGQDYESPVSYWMPFIGNSIGLHDAS